MPAQQPPSKPAGRPNQRKTPAEVSAGHAAAQVRLKEEAAARRAVSTGSPRASGISRLGHGHRSGRS
jgi:hypothetical protein